MKIITDNKYRNFLYGNELTENELKEFYYINKDDLPFHNFFRYKDWVYDPSEFIACNPNEELHKLGWHGYHSDSFFSGIVIKFSEDNEQICVGTYLS